uniref:VM domain-containing protein n=1 Tax=Anopheles epiroticus TaxID=199890 RepID=A0A182PNE5_9DIPT
MKFVTVIGVVCLALVLASAAPVEVQQLPAAAELKPADAAEGSEAQTDAVAAAPETNQDVTVAEEVLEQVNQVSNFAPEDEAAVDGEAQEGSELSASSRAKRSVACTELLGDDGVMRTVCDQDQDAESSDADSAVAFERSYGGHHGGGHGYGHHEAKGHGYGHHEAKEHGYGHEHKGYGHGGHEHKGYGGHEHKGYEHGGHMEHKGHGGHEHKGYGHGGHEHKGYGGHEHKGYEHKGHEHKGHEHKGYGHGGHMEHKGYGGHEHKGYGHGGHEHKGYGGHEHKGYGHGGHEHKGYGGHEHKGYEHGGHMEHKGYGHEHKGYGGHEHKGYGHEHKGYGGHEHKGYGHGHEHKKMHYRSASYTAPVAHHEASHGGYGGHAAPVKCGSNLLVGCAPTVAKVPCHPVHDHGHEGGYGGHHAASELSFRFAAPEPEKTEEDQE